MNRIFARRILILSSIVILSLLASSACGKAREIHVMETEKTVDTDQIILPVNNCMGGAEITSETGYQVKIDIRGASELGVEVGVVRGKIINALGVETALTVKHTVRTPAGWQGKHIISFQVTVSKGLITRDQSSGQATYTVKVPESVSDVQSSLERCPTTGAIDEQTKQAQIAATQTAIAEQTRQAQTAATQTAIAEQDKQAQIAATQTAIAEQTRQAQIAATQTAIAEQTREAQIAAQETRQAKVVATQRWGSCTWVEVGAIASHNPNAAWCPEGSFLTQFDLDGDRAYSEYDTPFVGQARCCTLNDPVLSRQWRSCNWVSVEKAGINSHAQGSPWCPDGSFLTQFDLDGDRNLLPSDAPIVGQAMCCTLNDPQFSRWESCVWQGVETIGINSHAREPVWGPQGTFLTAFDLDGPKNYDTHDAPVVGQALFCRAGLSD